MKTYWVLADRVWGAGLGSMIHTATAGLAGALDAGAVLVYERTHGSVFSHGAFCGDVRSFECFFQPLSRCAPGGTGDKAAVSREEGPAYREAVPLRFRTMLARTGWSLEDQLYWWRAQ